MKLSTWATCCAVIAMLLVAKVSAQFGAPSEGGQPTRSAEGEESALIAETPAGFETTRGSCRCIGERESASVAKIKQALRNPLKPEGFEFTDTPLEEVVTRLEEDYGVPVELDTTELEEIGIDAQEKVNASLHGISLSAALRLMFRPLELTCVVQDEVLLITTREGAEQLLVTCVYDVRDLLPRVRREFDFDSLIDTIVSCIATESWAENGGGESDIRPLHPGFLIISQTASVHDEIQELLNTVRQMKNRPATIAADSNPDVPLDEVVTESYRLQFESASITDDLRARVRELIVKAFPNERWDGKLDNGHSVLLAVLHDRVIVRHNPAVQDAIEELLTDSEIIATHGIAGPVGAHGCGGFGGGGFAPKQAEDAKINQK